MQIIYITKQTDLIPDPEIQVSSDFNYVSTFFAQHKIIQLDTETEGFSHTKKVLLIQFGSEVSDIQLVVNYQEYEPELLILLKKYEHLLYVIHHAQFDLRFLFYKGINFYNIWDTCIAEKCIKNGIYFDEKGEKASASLQYVSQKYLGIFLSKEERGYIHSRGINNSAVIKYAAKDVWKLESIMYGQKEEIKKLGIENWVKLELAFTPVLTRMVTNGLYLNWDKWVLKVKSKEKQLVKVKEELDSIARAEPKLQKFIDRQLDLFSLPKLNILWTSSKQVIPVMQSLGIDTKVKDKDSGQMKDSVEAKHLEKFSKIHPLISKYLEYKELEKEISTYGYTWQKQINPETGRIHTTFNQIIDTSRMSSGDKRSGSVNLQNIPSDAETRACFTSHAEDWSINSCDYSSQETVYAAEITQDLTLLSIVNEGRCMHCITGTAISKILTGTHQEVTKENGLKTAKGEKLRDIAKKVNFSIQYLVQANTLSQNLQCSVDEAKEILKATIKQFQRRHDFYEEVFLESLRNGYITVNKKIGSKYLIENHKFLKDTVINYKGYYINQEFKFRKEIPYETLRKFRSSISTLKRSCSNFPIQGSCASITKLAAILFDKYLTENNLHKYCMIVNLIHDECLLEVHDDYKEQTSKALLDCMAKAGDYFCKTVKMKAEPNIQKYWAK